MKLQLLNKHKVRMQPLKFFIIFIIILFTSKIALINAQDTYSLYETIDSTSSIGVKEIMIKISNNSVELYTLPKEYSTGTITANKGRLVNEENSMYYQIDTTWMFSSNFGRLTNLRINCVPKLKVGFNKDSTVINLKLIRNLKNTKSMGSPSSKIKYRMICQCIEDYEELTLHKVEYFQNEFDWNCGSFKNWKRQLTSHKISNCSDQSESRTK